MTNNFHHAPNIGAKSRSPNIVLGVCGPGLKNWSPAYAVTISPGSMLIDAAAPYRGGLITWFHTRITAERRTI